MRDNGHRLDAALSIVECIVIVICRGQSCFCKYRLFVDFCCDEWLALFKISSERFGEDDDGSGYLELP